MSHQEIDRLAGILADDVTAVEKRERILAELGIPPTSRQDPRSKYPHDSFSYFVDGLHKSGRGLRTNDWKCCWLFKKTKAEYDAAGKPIVV